MTLDEFLVDFGVNVDTQKLANFVTQVESSAKKIADKADNASKAIEGIGDKSAQSSRSVDSKALLAGKELDKLKSKARTVTLAVAGLAAGVALFITSGINGAKDLAKQKGKLFDITQNELAQADEYSRAMNKTGLSIQSLKTKIALNLAPALTRVTNGFNDWLTANKELIANGLTQLIKWSGKVIQVVANTVRFFAKWPAVLLAIVAALAIFKKAMIVAAIQTAIAWALNPFTWIVIGIMAVMLLIDDFMVWMRGGKSLFSDYWQWVADAWNNIKNKFSDGIQYVKRRLELVWAIITYPFKKAFKFVKSLFDIAKDDSMSFTEKLGAAFSVIFDHMTAPFKDAFKFVLGLFGMSEDEADKYVDNIGKSFDGVIDAIITPFKEAFDWVMAYYNKTVGKVSGVLNAAKGKASGAWDSVTGWFGSDNSASAPKVAAGNGAGQTTINGGDVNAQITISANNSDEAMRGVMGGLNSANKRSMSNLRGAVAG